MGRLIIQSQFNAGFHTFFVRQKLYYFGIDIIDTGGKIVLTIAKSGHILCSLISPDDRILTNTVSRVPLTRFLGQALF